MRHHRLGILTGLLLAVTMVASACAPVAPSQSTQAPAPAPAPTQTTSPAPAPAGPKGKLVVALDATPPHLDQMSNTTIEVVLPSNQIYEKLFGFDAGFKPVPMLVDTYEVDSAGKMWSFTLRKGVKFHNGKEMTVDDVEASYNRWRTTSQIARQWNDVKFERVGDYAFRLNSATPRASMLFDLSQSSQALVIMPKEIVTGVAANELKQFIGTGPFMFDSMVPDQYVRMKAFPGYVSRTDTSSGHTGAKKALVADLEFRIIKDVPTRVAALRAGEVHVIPDGIPGADKATLQADSNIRIQLIKGNQKWGPIFNGKSPLGGNKKVRQAVAAVLDHEEIALAITGDPTLFDINPGLSAKGTFFYSDAGAAKFNYRNVNEAKRLLTEAGYKGEEIVIISTKANIFQDKMATVMESQMKAAGMKVRIDWYDGATIRQVRTQPDKWDIIPGGWGTTFDPGIYGQGFTCASGSWIGHCHKELDALFDKAGQTVDLNQRKQVYADLQKLMIEDIVGQILLGDFHALRAYRANVKGVQEFKDFVAWNVSVD